MAVRDLGVRPYEGERLPPTRNVWVLFRFGLRRTWASWMVRIATAFFWLPALLAVGALWVRVLILGQAEDAAAAAQAIPVEPGRVVADTLGWVVWIVASLVTLGAGAGAIAQDLTHDALPFFFSKPVTPSQYLAGRVGAVALWLFGAVFGNAALVVLAGLVPTTDAALRLEQAGLLLPAALVSALVAAVLATASVGTSAIGKSRALTMSAWVLVFVVPHLLGWLVQGLADWPWLLLASLPAMLGVVSGALFKIEPDTALRWWHALPVLLLATGGFAALALRRLRTTEVVA